MKQIRKGAPYLLALSVLTFLLFVFFPRSSSQQQGPTLYVNNIDPTCGGSSPCFASIQAAVDAAVSGDTIRIRAGTYLEQVTGAVLSFHKISLDNWVEVDWGRRLVRQHRSSSSSANLIIGESWKGAL